MSERKNKKRKEGRGGGGGREGGREGGRCEGGLIFSTTKIQAVKFLGKKQGNSPQRTAALGSRNMTLVQLLCDPPRVVKIMSQWVRRWIHTRRKV